MSTLNLLTDWKAAPAPLDVAYIFSLPNYGRAELVIRGAAEDIPLITEWLNLIVQTLPSVLGSRE